MDLDDYREYILSEVSIWASADKNFTHSAFVDLTAQLLQDAEEISNFEPCYYRGVGARRRNVAVDGYAFDDADDSLRLVIAQPSLAPTAPVFGQSEARGWFGQLRAFVEEAFEGGLQRNADPSTPEHGLATEIASRRDRLARVRAFLVTDQRLSTRAKDWPEGDVYGVPIEFHVWDIERFYRAHISRAGRDDVEIDFGAFPGGGVPCIAAGSSGEDLESYLCVIPGRTLAAIYEEHGSRLLEGNVRSFLTTKRKVNRGIRNTILHRPNLFFAFNNGIGTTAQAAVFRDGEQGDGIRILTKVKDLQIVNGGQTTVSLATAHRTDKNPLDGVFVPMKLSVVAPERAEAIVQDISRSANSQNPVSEADFFSNHPYHRRLEEISRRLATPAKAGAQHGTRWFYERARGQYMNATFALTLTERRRFLETNPREQVLTKTDLAKSENSWREMPQIVSKGAQKNFSVFADFIAKAWDASEADFNEEYFRAVVGRVILFRSLERLVSEQAWYSGGYRANVVTYSMAKLAQMIREQAPRRSLDFRSIWNRGSISVGLTRQLRLVAKAMHDVIVDPPAGIQNVTEWSKRDQCWERAEAVALTLEADFARELVSLDAVKEAQREARTQQKVDSGISAQEMVIKLGQEYWTGVRSWGRSQGFVLNEDETLLRMAAEYAPRIPLDRESRKLLELKERYELEGMPPTELE